MAKMRWDSLSNPRNLVAVFVSEDGNWLVRPVLETEGVKVIGWELVDLTKGSGSTRFKTPQMAWSHVESRPSQELAS